MSKLSKSAETMFASQKGSELYARIVKTIEKENMSSLMDKGILVGLSGGADSVFLLRFLREYKRREEKSFHILALHVNHGIRGDEAKRDEDFSKQLADDLGVEFMSRHVDVPAISKESGLGIEETARNARYSIFSDILSGRNDLGCISVAHNATDNTETVLFNILRGSGISGMCGIKPIRDNIIRPIISVSKSEIVSVLDDNAIPYVTDSTNLSVDYSRNYIRNEILPLLTHLSNNPDAAFYRLTENMRCDLDYLNKEADRFINDECHKAISSEKLRSLHPSLQAKVISKLAHKNAGIYPEEKHITALRELLKNDNFRYSLPGEKDFLCERGVCSFSPKKAENDVFKQIFLLKKGENKITGTNLTVYIGEVDKTSLNVYNFAIHTTISSAIIDEGLILRFRSDGDSYRYAGMTHKLKKVFNDRNIPPTEREKIPMICDSKGIVFVPGMSERDGAKSDVSTDNIPITFAYAYPKNGEKEAFTALLRR